MRVTTRSYITNCLTATPFIRGNPNVRCVNGNVGVLRLHDNVEKIRKSNPVLTARIRNYEECNANHRKNRERE